MSIVLARTANMTAQLVENFRHCSQLCNDSQKISTLITAWLSGQRRYMYLRDRSDKGRKCWPEINTIAAELNCSRTMIKRALYDPEKRGIYIQRLPRYKESGSRSSNLYMLVDGWPLISARGECAYTQYPVSVHSESPWREYSKSSYREEIDNSYQTSRVYWRTRVTTLYSHCHLTIIILQYHNIYHLIWVDWYCFIICIDHYMMYSSFKI